MEDTFEEYEELFSLLEDMDLDRFVSQPEQETV